MHLQISCYEVEKKPFNQLFSPDNLLPYYALAHSSTGGVVGNAEVAGLDRGLVCPFQPETFQSCDATKKAREI
jgi:hypothetical protein